MVELLFLKDSFLKMHSEICIVLIFVAALTRCHRLGGLNNRNVFPHSSGGPKSKIKMSAGPAWGDPRGEFVSLSAFGGYPQLVAASLSPLSHYLLFIWLCLISLCLSFMKIHVVAFRANLDNVRQIPP